LRVVKTGGIIPTRYASAGLHGFWAGDSLIPSEMYPSKSQNCQTGRIMECCLSL